MTGGLLLVAMAAAEVQRFAVVVGNNEGAQGDDALIFAEQDARKIHGVLTELGGVSLMNTRTLLGKGRGDLIREMAAMQGPIASAKQNV